MNAANTAWLVALVIGCVVGSSGCRGRNQSVVLFQRDVILVGDVAIDRRHVEAAHGAAPEDCFDQLIRRHATTAGSSLVVGRARFGEGRADVVDDETFDLLTIQVPPAQLGSRISVPSPDVVVRRSYGPRYGYLSCRGAVSEEATGSLRIEFTSGGDMQVEIDLVMKERGVRPPFAGDSSRVRESFVARRATYSIVDPATGYSLQFHPRQSGSMERRRP